MSQRRVVVTGLGMVSPLGNTVASTWEGILAGRSGVTNIDHFDVSKFTTRFGAGLKDFSVDSYFPAKDARKMDPFIQYGMVAGIQAFEDSGLEVTVEVGGRNGIADRGGRAGSSESKSGDQCRATTG